MKFGTFSAVALAATLFAVSYQPAQAFTGAAAPAPVPLPITNFTAGDGQVIQVQRVRRPGVRRGGVRRGRVRRGRTGRAIAGGIIAGALIGAAIANSRERERPRRRSASRAHEDWCYDRYRSYRAYDNTYQPFRGPRRECRSPYY